LLMHVIQGKGVVIFGRSELPKSRLLSISPEFVNKIKEETSWIMAKGEQLLASLMLPPLQVVASGINFCTLLLSGNHLFELPFGNLEAITDTKSLIENASRKGSRKRAPERAVEKTPERTEERELIS